MPKPVTHYRLYDASLVESSPCAMEPHPGGEYILAADYGELEAENDTLRQESVALRITLSAEQNESARLREQLKEARKVIDELLDDCEDMDQDRVALRKARAFLARTE